MKVKIKLKPINLTQLKQAIKIGFSDDDKLFEYYHDLPEYTLDKCVEHTYGIIAEAYTDIRLQVSLFGIYYNGKNIGYTVIISEVKNILFSFAINGKYRHLDGGCVKISWLGLVDKLFRNPYYVKLERKNSRAVKFFLANGFEEIPVLSDEKHITLLIL